jgi:hypothetical protein
VKLPYREGTLFAVPLRNGGFALGIVARATKKGRVILCYFFGPRRNCIPALFEIKHLRPADAVRVILVGDLGLIEGEWPVIGECAHWKREEWPIPVFLRNEPISGRRWRVYHSDTDPNLVLREEPSVVNDEGLEPDGLYGSGAAELLLTKLLG